MFVKTQDVPVRKPPRHKKAVTLRAVLANLLRDLRVWWRK